MTQSAERRPSGRREEQVSATRQRILEAARSLFSEHGYDATSVRMVARACGLTNPAVHYHFRTKRDLYDALLSEPLTTTYDGRSGDRFAIAANMEQRFYQWVDNIEFARLLLRQQVGGDRQSLDYLRDSERSYVADLSHALSPLYGGDAAERAARLAFTLLSGALWDAILTYGDDTATIMRDEYYRLRVRGFIEAALQAAQRGAP